MTKEIPLTQGKFALIDDDDYEEISKNSWCYLNGYAIRGISIKNKDYTVFMHRQINKTEKGKQTDHINGNRLDNRKENLRTCNNMENQRNTHWKKTNTSGYKGVYYAKKSNKWCAQIKNNNKTMYIGEYEIKEDAARAYDKKAKELFGEFACLNFPEVSQ